MSRHIYFKMIFVDNLHYWFLNQEDTFRGSIYRKEQGNSTSIVSVQIIDFFFRSFVLDNEKENSKEKCQTLENAASIYWHHLRPNVSTQFGHEKAPFPLSQLKLRFLLLPFSSTICQIWTSQGQILTKTHAHIQIVEPQNTCSHYSIMT